MDKTHEGGPNYSEEDEGGSSPNWEFLISSVQFYMEGTQSREFSGSEMNWKSI